MLAATRPGLVFAADAGRFAGTLALDDLAGVEVVAARTDGAPRAVTPLRELEKASGDAAVDAAHAAVGPDTLAKILFTSGSTSAPKGVLTTHGMMCVNQAQIRQVWPFLGERPPRIVDWLPWNHVFGGSHNFNIRAWHARRGWRSGRRAREDGCFAAQVVSDQRPLRSPLGDAPGSSG